MHVRINANELARTNNNINNTNKSATATCHNDLCVPAIIPRLLIICTHAEREMDLCSHVLFRRRGGNEIAREKTICTQNREILFLPDKFHKVVHVE